MIRNSHSSTKICLKKEKDEEEKKKEKKPVNTVFLSI